jgi:hypothetical protein
MYFLALLCSHNREGKDELSRTFMWQDQKSNRQKIKNHFEVNNNKVNKLLTAVTHLPPFYKNLRMNTGLMGGGWLLGWYVGPGLSLQCFRRLL